MQQKVLYINLTRTKDNSAGFVTHHTANRKQMGYSWQS